MKFIILFVHFLIIISPAFSSVKPERKQDADQLTGHRFLTFNTVIRVNQIEVARDKNVGRDERHLHTPEKVIKFREAIEKGFAGSRITWAFSWLALHDTTTNYKPQNPKTPTVQICLVIVIVIEFNIFDF